MTERLAGLVCVILAAVLTALTARPASAATTASWSADVADEFAAGTLDGTAVDREGHVRLAPARSTWFGPDDGIVWQVRPDGEQAAFVALSGPGRLLRIDADGGAETWFRAEGEGLVTALDVDSAGRPVIGISPDARVVRVIGTDEHEELAVLQAAFVWAVVHDADGTWIGTGSPGAVLRLDASGLVATVFETGDDPVRAIARDPAGGVVIGTGGRGRVVRIDRDGRPFVLFDADETEIVAVAVDPAGVVWALAARGAKRVAAADAAARAAAAGTTVRVTATPPPAPEGAGEEQDTATSRTGSAARSPSRPSFQLPPGGALYRIEPAGGVRRVWSTGNELPFGLALVGADRVIVTTGDEGAVHELDASGEGTRLVRIASSQASAVDVTAAGRLLVGGTTDARVEALGAGPRREGSFLTPPIDAGSSAEWGAIRWDAYVPRGAGLALHARGGNTDDPDETWTDWVPVDGQRGDADRAIVAGVPETRFLQVRATLTARPSGESPVLRGLEQFYRPRNRAPEVAEVGVEAPGIVLIPAPAQGANALGPVVADDPVARQAAETVGRSRSMPMRRGWEAGARTFTWKAEDPDGDRLRYRVDIRLEGGAAWLPLARDLDDTHFSWDGRAMPDGRYRVRVVASDRLDNPDGDDHEDWRTSEAFLVDNVRPVVAEVAATPQAGGWRLDIATRDEGGGVAAVEVAIDGGRWRPVDPADGVADGIEEGFRLELPAKDEGVQVVMIRVIDAAGNVGGALWRP